MAAMTVIAGSASAQKTSSAERGLIGVNLYDSGVKVVSLYGSPDEVQAVTIGGTTQNGGGGGFGGPGFGGAGGGGGADGGRGGRGGGASGGASADWQLPNMGSFDFGSDVLRQAPSLSGPSSPSGSGGPPPGMGGRPGGPPPGMGGPGFGPGGPGGGGGAPADSGPLAPTQYTRWVYNRAGSKYGFIVDNQNRVVQIEAIGLQNNRVKTRKGLGFGATFAQIIKTYGNPDGYEVGGDSILIKYLVNKKVAFRLNRLGAKKPHVVTGIVVSAGKV